MLQRRGRIDVGVHPRCDFELFFGQSSGNAHHLHHVLDPLLAQRIGVRDLVGQRQFVEQHIQMAHRSVHIHRLDRVSSGDMDAVEVLGQLQQVCALCTRARHLSRRHVPVIGRRRDIHEDDIAATDRQFPLRVSGRDGEFRRRLAHHLHHPVATHLYIRTLNGAARLPEQVERFLVKKLDSDLFKDPHCAIVDRLDTLGRQRFGGTVGIDRNAPLWLSDHVTRCKARIACPSACAASSWCV